MDVDVDVMMSGLVPFCLQGPCGGPLTGLLLVDPLKRTKNDAFGRGRVGIYRKIIPGIELAARNKRTLERAGSYPNQNRRPIVSNRALPLRQLIVCCRWPIYRP